LDLNAGWLEGLVDLNTEKENVQGRIADYLTDLYSIGFSGIRIDAAKHIAPDDIIAIFTQFRANIGGQLPSDFIAWLEVLLGGESDMLMCNPDSGYNYGAYLEDGLLAAGFSQDEVSISKIYLYIMYLDNE
jgi:alpha-amylase